MAEVENEISQGTLEIANVRARIERLMKITADLDNQIAQKNEIISRSEAEIVKRNAIIERKQNIIDQFNKKLEQMISKAGVREFSILSIAVNLFLTFKKQTRKFASAKLKKNVSSKLLHIENLSTREQTV